MTIWKPSIEPDSVGASPLYVRIARAIEHDVRDGRLAPGDRLPTHRDLADQLNVTVGTISRAYAAAQRAGWLRGEVGRGTFVRADEELGVRRIDVGAGAELDLSVNLPVEAGAPDLAAALRVLARRSDLASLMRYQPSEGSVSDRSAGSELLRSHGIEVGPERVVLCAGAQHGLAVALDSLAKAGDSVAAAELTSPGFRPLAERRGLRIHSVPLDRHGIVPEAVEESCRRAPIRALYVVPTYQNPTAVTLPEKRRRQLAQLAERFDFVVIEDDIHRLLAAEHPPAIAALAPDRTIYIASLSKCLAPGLRSGYLSPPPRLRERIVDAVWSSLWTVSPVTAALSSQWIRDGTLDAVVIRKREEAAARQSIARRILGLAMPPNPTAAYHLWLKLDGNRDAMRFTADAAARGVRVTPAAAFGVGRQPTQPAVRLALGAAPDRERLKRGLETLVSVLHEEEPPVTVRV